MHMGWQPQSEKDEGYNETAQKDVRLLHFMHC